MSTQMNTESTAGVAGSLPRKRVDTARCGVRTLCSPPCIRMVDREVRCRLAKAWPTARLPRFDPSTIRRDGWQRVAMQRLGSAPSPQGCARCTVRQHCARSPIGRRRHLELVNSAGSNPAARTNATVAQPVGGSGFKHRAVSVRIGPVAPFCSSSPTAEARPLKRRKSRFESAGEHRLLLSTAVNRPTAKQGRGVERFESSGAHHAIYRCCDGKLGSARSLLAGCIADPVVHPEHEAS